MKKDLKINEGYLKRLGTNKDLFIRNLKKAKRYNKNTIMILNNASNFENFLIDSFIWSGSFEGDKFWREISKN